jgi:hypothetical protein
VQLDAAIKLGADAGVNYWAQDLATEVRPIADGARVYVVLENIGACFRRPAGDRGGPRRRPPAARREASLSDPDHDHRRSARQSGNFELSLRVEAEGPLTALIDQVLPPSQAAHAHELVEARRGWERSCSIRPD